MHATDYTVPGGDGTPPAGGCSAINGRDHAVWFPEFERGWLGRFDPVTKEITQRPLPTPAAPGAIIVDDQGAFWTDEYLGNKIAGIDPLWSLTEWTVPTPLAGPSDVTVRCDGNIWFTEMFANKTGAMDPGTGTFREYGVSTFLVAHEQRCLGAVGLVGGRHTHAREELSVVVGDDVAPVAADPLGDGLAAEAHLGIDHRTHTVFGHALADLRPAAVGGCLLDVLVEGAGQQVTGLGEVIVRGGGLEQGATELDQLPQVGATGGRGRPSRCAPCCDTGG